MEKYLQLMSPIHTKGTLVLTTRSAKNMQPHGVNGLIVTYATTHRLFLNQ
jgi:hypothetical protein